MKFEIGEWIHNHQYIYDLSQSGMYGRIALNKYFQLKSLVNEDDLKGIIANINNCGTDQIVITHGATEAIFTTLYHIHSSGVSRFRTNFPEYEPLYKVPPFIGLSLGDRGLFVCSNPNNPTGVLHNLPKDYDYYLIDETFLEFSKNLDSMHYPSNTYRINTFTKFYGGDDLRVGYIIAPDKESALQLGLLRGIFTEYVSRYNISVAYQILKDHETLVPYIREIQQKNFNYLNNLKGKLNFYNGITPSLGTVSYLDYSQYTDSDSLRLAEDIAKHSISVVPAKFFNHEGTYLRICYSRSNFKESYLQLMEYFDSTLSACVES